MQPKKQCRPQDVRLQAAKLTRIQNPQPFIFVRQLLSANYKLKLREN